MIDYDENTWESVPENQKTFLDFGCPECGNMDDFSRESGAHIDIDNFKIQDGKFVLCGADMRNEGSRQPDITCNNCKRNFPAETREFDAKTNKRS